MSSYWDIIFCMKVPSNPIFTEMMITSHISKVIQSSLLIRHFFTRRISIQRRKQWIPRQFSYIIAQKHQDYLKFSIAIRGWSRGWSQRPQLQFCQPLIKDHRKSALPIAINTFCFLWSFPPLSTCRRITARCEGGIVRHKGKCNWGVGRSSFPGDQD